MDGNSGARVRGQLAFPWSIIHARIASRSKFWPDFVITGSSNTCNVRGQMNSCGTSTSENSVVHVALFGISETEFRGSPVELYAFGFMRRR